MAQSKDKAVNEKQETGTERKSERMGERAKKGERERQQQTIVPLVNKNPSKKQQSYGDNEVDSLSRR